MLQGGPHMSGRVWTDIRIDCSLLGIGVLTAGARTSVTGLERGGAGKGREDKVRIGDFRPQSSSFLWWATGARSPGTEIRYVWMYL